MQNLYYSDLRTQDYLKIPGIKTDEAQNLFQWRLRMAPLVKNFRGNSGHVVCPLCQNHLNNQRLAFQCEKLRYGAVGTALLSASRESLLSYTLPVRAIWYQSLTPFYIYRFFAPVVCLVFISRLCFFYLCATGNSIPAHLFAHVSI